MKVLIFAAFFVSILAMTVANESYKKFIEECVKEYSIPKEAIDTWNDGKLPQNIPKFKDMLLCFLKKGKVMNDAGIVDMNEMKKATQEDLGSEEAANRMIELCMQNNVGGAQGAWDLQECYLKNKAALKIV